MYTLIAVVFIASCSFGTQNPFGTLYWIHIEIDCIFPFHLQRFKRDGWCVDESLSKWLKCYVFFY